VKTRMLAAALSALLLFTSSAHAQAGPTASLVGKTATLCGINSPFEMTVVQTDWQKSSGSIEASGMWAIVIAEMTNTGERPDTTRNLFFLKDSQDRRFVQVIGEDAVTLIVELLPKYGLTGSINFVAPGQTARHLFAFDVPEDVTGLDIEPDPQFCK